MNFLNDGAQSEAAVRWHEGLSGVRDGRTLRL